MIESSIQNDDTIKAQQQSQSDDNSNMVESSIVNMVESVLYHGQYGGHKIFVSAVYASSIINP
jgi:nitrogen regulatory protein PII